jgi:hypothetical protein
MPEGARLPLDATLGCLYTTSKRSFVCGRVFGASPTTQASVFVFGARPWDDAEADEFFALLKLLVNEHGLPDWSFTFASTATINASQRSRLATEFPIERPIRSVTITQSAIQRIATKAVATVFRLRKSPLTLECFAPADIRKAVTWLRAPPEVEQHLTDALRVALECAGYTPQTALPGYFTIAA